MNILPNPPTSYISQALVHLIENGCATLGVEALFPGIPVYPDEEPANVIAPYIIVDCTADPQTYAKSALWSQRVSLRLVQPRETPTDEDVSLDYDSTLPDDYEANMAALVYGRWPIAGTTYAGGTRATYSTLSDLLTVSATALGVDLILVDTASLHRPDCDAAGLPTRTKMPISNDNEIEFEFVLVGAVTD